MRKRTREPTSPSPRFPTKRTRHDPGSTSSSSSSSCSSSSSSSSPPPHVPRMPHATMDSLSLTGLLTVLPEWQSRLLALTTRFPAHAGVVPAVCPGPPGLTSKDKGSKLQPRPTTPPSTTKPTEVGNRKLLAKPRTTKAKFLSITGPDIYYDGDSQQCLFDCWTVMNSKRGFLRKEMMAIKRKKVLTLPTTDYGYSDLEDEIEADSDSEDESEEDKKERLEAESVREVAEKLKMEQALKTATFLEEVDACLDKAAKACENSAYLLLKGEGCAGHIVFITERMNDAIARVNKDFGPINVVVAAAPEETTAVTTSNQDDEGVELC